MDYPHKYFTAEKVTVVTPPAIEPVTLDEAKENSRIFTNVQDSLVTRLIAAARMNVEMFLERALIERTLAAYLQQFQEVIYLRFPPLISVESIKYTDPDGAEQTVDPTVYYVDVWASPGLIRLQKDQLWPEIGDVYDPIRIEYKAGYGQNTTDVPEDIRAGLLALITMLYDNPSVIDPAGRSNEMQALYQNIFSMNRMYI